MSLGLLFPSYVELRYTPINLTTGHIYKLSLQIRSNVAQQVNVWMEAAGANAGLNQYKVITSGAWQTIQFTFTATATSAAAFFRLFLQPTAQTTYIDKVNLIDYTLYRKEYRLMRIQGSMFPGSFVQTLTLREITSQETA